MFDNGAQLVLCYEKYRDVFVFFLLLFDGAIPLL